MKVRRSGLAVVTVVAMAAAMVGVSVAPASAATTWTVTNCGDSGSGSLRQAVAGSGSGDTIVFALAPSCSLITLTSGEIPIAQSVTITGPGAVNLAVSGNSASRVFNVTVGTVVAISGLTIENGFGQNGGGILNQGAVTVTDTTIANNSMPDTSSGGGIMNDGSLTVSNSTLQGNTAPGFGLGAAIASDGSSVTVTNTTLSGNTSDHVGGGIANEGSGSVAVTDSTLTGNSAAHVGGGIFNEGSGSVAVTDSTLSGNDSGIAPNGGGIFNVSGSLTVTGSTFTSNSNDGAIVNYGSALVGGSIFAGGDVCFGGVAITNVGYNVDEGHSCVTAAANGSLIDTPSGLDPAGLANHGGPTHTIALTSGAAIGLIPNPTSGLCPRVDQRGEPNGFGQPCDAGAYQNTLVGNGILDRGEQCDDGNLINGDGCNNLGQIEHPQTISFTAPATGLVGGGYTASATATSGLAVSFTRDGSSTGCALSAGGIVIYTGAGMCRIDANQSGDATHLRAPQVQRVTVIQPRPSGFRVTTTSLPNAKLGAAYSATLTATGGTAPYHWKKLSKLPKGLRLTGKTGVISGTPKIRGTSSFTVQVTDSKKPNPKRVTTKTFSITIT